MQLKKRPVYLLLLLLAAMSVEACDTTISSCNSAWTDNTVYCLDTDIITGTACMVIASNTNVTLDCQGNSITGLSALSDDGIAVLSSSSVSILNCLSDGWQRSIYVFDSPNTILNNNTASGSISGIVVDTSNGTNVTNNTAFDNSIGLGFYGSNIYSFNNTAYRNNQGFFMSGAQNSTFDQSRSYNNTHNVHITRSSGLLFSNSTLSNATEHDVFLEIDQNSDPSICDNALVNVTGSVGDPVSYYNTTTTLANANFSELIFCNADDSVISNVSLHSLSDRPINAIFVYDTDRANFTNISTLETRYGFYFFNSTNTRVENSISVNGSTTTGFYIQNSLNNTIFKSDIIGQQEAITLDESDGNLISNDNFTNNTYSIHVKVGVNNTAESNAFNSGVYQLFIEDSSSSNTHFYNNTIYDAVYGTNITDAVYNLIDNNTYSGTLGVVLDGTANNNTIQGNVFKTTSTALMVIDGNTFINNTLGTNFPTTTSFDYSGALNFSGVEAPPASQSYLYNIGRFLEITNTSSFDWTFVNISYDNSTIAPTNESNLKLYRYAGGIWQVINTSTVDTGNSSVSANVTNFSTYGLFFNFSFCGNNITEPGEVCDGSNLTGQTCANFGFNSGTLACNPSCTTYNTSNCTTVATGGGGGGSSARYTRAQVTNQTVPPLPQLKIPIHPASKSERKPVESSSHSARPIFATQPEPRFPIIPFISNARSRTSKWYIWLLLLILAILAYINIQSKRRHKHKGRAKHRVLKHNKPPMDGQVPVDPNASPPPTNDFK